ncbi:MAG: tetratricopeptide repeat protein [Pseudomonadota bacterium]|nr:tetratricopeptide repeat protein [Pseudomonadota bacterium]
MKSSLVLRVAASTAVIGVTMVSCKPAAVRPASASAVAPKSEAGAAKLYAQVQAQVQQGDLAEALTLAERMVELAPRDTGYRMLLADLYLKNGRFVSAEAAFSDVLVLDPANSRAGLTRALTMIGQGKNGEAMIELDRLTATASPADVGLAFALAGQPQRAIEMLEPAARAPDANGRIRQNLALAYALSGDWQKARIVAAQDLSPAELGRRLQHWASLTNPAAPFTQVAAVLGVSPVEDAGQPTRLALAPAAPQQAYAETEIPAPADAAPVQMAAAAPVAVGGPVETISEIKTEAYAYQPPEHADAFSAPIESASAEVPVAAAPAEATRFAAAVNSLVESPVQAQRPVAPVAKAPLLAFTPIKAAAKPRVKGTGRYVVQIGAYRNARQVEQAWARAHRHYGFGDNQPLSTTVSIPGKGIFHRLAVAGFEKPMDAAQLCQSIRVKGGACFVRATAGDAPVRWASRYAGRA